MSSPEVRLWAKLFPYNNFLTVSCSLDNYILQVPYNADELIGPLQKNLVLPVLFIHAIDFRLPL